MRPVNLLPPEHRPRGRASASAREGSAYVVLGALVVVLVAAFVYVHTLNSVTDRRNETVRLKTETQRLETRAAQLGSFADFQSLKATRESAVRQVAGRRFDWERLVREVAHLTPADVWYTDFEASVTPASGAAAGGTGAAAGAPAGAAGAASGAAAGPPGAASAAGPTVNLGGCARSQQRVADLLLRLRMTHSVKDVKLSESARGEDQAAAPGGGASPAAAGTEGCGEHRGKPNFKFVARLDLEPVAGTAGATGTPPPSGAGAAAATPGGPSTPPAPAPKRTPTALGGGS